MVLVSCLVMACAAKQGGVKDAPAPAADAAVVDSGIERKFLRASELLREDRYDEAIALLRQVVEQERRFPGPYVNLGMAYARKGDAGHAEQQLAKAVEIDPANAEANNELGLLFRKNGRFDDARKAYETALAAHPEYLPARKNLGILCEIYLRNLDCALRQFEQYQTIAPDDREVSLWVSDLRLRTGH